VVKCYVFSLELCCIALAFLFPLGHQPRFCACRAVNGLTARAAVSQHISNPRRRAGGPKECPWFSIRERPPLWTARRAAPTPFLRSLAFRRRQHERREPRGLCGVWGGLSSLGGSNNSQSL